MGTPSQCATVSTDCLQDHDGSWKWWHGEAPHGDPGCSCRNYRHEEALEEAEEEDLEDLENQRNLEVEDFVQDMQRNLQDFVQDMENHQNLLTMMEPIPENLEDLEELADDEEPDPALGSCE